MAMLETMAMLEQDPEATFSDFTATSQGNLLNFTGCRVTQVETEKPDTSGLPARLEVSVPKDLLFFDVDLHKRRSGLQGLRRNTTATLCTKCFQVFLEVAHFMSHSCLGLENSVDATRAVTVTVRNESNWPPDLGNGYRKPLWYADPNEKLPVAIRCTKCDTTCETISILHCHMIECGNKVPTQQLTSRAKVRKCSDVEDVTGQIGIGKSPSTRSIKRLSPPGPPTVRQNRYNMRRMLTSRRYRREEVG